MEEWQQRYSCAKTAEGPTVEAAVAKNIYSLCFFGGGFFLDVFRNLCREHQYTLVNAAHAEPETSFEPTVTLTDGI